jgi:hypothetical protein
MRATLLFTGTLIGLVAIASLAGARCRDPQALANARTAVAQQCDCAGAQSHGAYLGCVSNVVHGLRTTHALSAVCGAEVLRCANHSTCGLPGHVTCCRKIHHDRAPTKCIIVRRADRCRAPHGGGSVSVGQCASCCDACGQGECAAATTPTTTSTTTRPSTTSPTTTTPSTTSTSTPGTTGTSTTSTSSTSTTSLCFPNGQECSNDSNCCNQSCHLADNVMGGLCCAGNASCSTDNDCCEGECEEGNCCAGLGEGCKSVPCCASSGQICSDSFFHCCGLTHGRCFNDSDCCGTYRPSSCVVLVPGGPATCCSNGGCTDDSDCCGPGVCLGGGCEPGCTQEGAACGVFGECQCVQGCGHAGTGPTCTGGFVFVQLPCTTDADCPPCLLRGAPVCVDNLDVDFCDPAHKVCACTC